MNEVFDPDDRESSVLGAPLLNVAVRAGESGKDVYPDGPSHLRFRENRLARQNDPCQNGPDGLV
jgi:hypothetical protein